MKDHLKTQQALRAFSVNAMAGLVGENALEDRQTKPFHEVRRPILDRIACKMKLPQGATYSFEIYYHSTLSVGCSET
jgi:hypothetical protein